MRMFGLFGWILLLPPPNVAFEPFCVSGEEWFSHIMSGICFEKINWAITIVYLSIVALVSNIIVCGLIRFLLGAFSTTL